MLSCLLCWTNELRWCCSVFFCVCLHLLPFPSERVKKLKKRGLDDVEFFRSTAVYLQQCSANAMSGKMEVRTSAEAG